MLPALTRRWARLNDGALLAQLGAGNTGGTLGGATKLVRQLVQTAMLAAGAWLVIVQDVTAGVMIAATIILGRALAPIETLVAGWRSLVEARSAWRSLQELLSREEKDAKTELPAPTGAIEAERVTFAFPGADRPVLRGVSFSLQAGEALGVVGPSASGKSTLLRLALGVWKPSSGTMRLDGADAAAWPREQLGAHVGYLPQDVELFSGTVAENIARLAEPDAAAVVRAAQRAHVHDMILRLPNGYDTEAGEAGQALSPGQRQRIALARALYSEMSGSPRLVVLDEPNASLDHRGRRGTASHAPGPQGEGRDGADRGASPVAPARRRQAARAARRRGGHVRAARDRHGEADPSRSGGCLTTELDRAADPRRIVRAGLLAIALGCTAFGVWAAYAPLSGAVIAPGFVKIDLNRKLVQHQEGGIVRAVRVRDGDRVQAGQELVVLDDVRIDAQLDLLRTQLDAEHAKAARLEAERAYLSVLRPFQRH